MAEASIPLMTSLWQLTTQEGMEAYACVKPCKATSSLATSVHQTLQEAFSKQAITLCMTHKRASWCCSILMRLLSHMLSILGQIAPWTNSWLLQRRSWMLNMTIRRWSERQSSRYTAATNQRPCVLCLEGVMHVYHECKVMSETLG